MNNLEQWDVEAKATSQLYRDILAKLTDMQVEIEDWLELSKLIQEYGTKEFSQGKNLIKTIYNL